MKWKEFKNGVEEFKKRITYYLFGPNLEKDEQILHVVHRHPFMMVKATVLITFVHFFIPTFLWYVFPEIWFVFMVWMIYGFIKINIALFSWYFDAILVTNMSLISVKWNNPFDRNSVRLEYAMVEGTSYAFKGVMQTVFNYGNIQINRQGGGVGVELHDASNPAKVESVILSYQEKYLADKNLEDIGSLKSLLTEMIRKHAKELKEIEVDF